MSVTSIIITIIIVAVVVTIRKKSSANNVQEYRPGNGNVQESFVEPAEEPAEESAYEFSGDPEIDALFEMTTHKLISAVMPDKHGDFNEAKKVGKTIAAINEEVSRRLEPGSEVYVDFFNSMYNIVLGTMMRSGVEMLEKAAEYTLAQQEEYEVRGKCQTFVKGLSEDPLVAKAEVIMSVCEKCWFGNIKTTMFRKELEKHNLPKSI